MWLPPPAANNRPKRGSGLRFLLGNNVAKFLSDRPNGRWGLVSRRLKDQSRVGPPTPLPLSPQLIKSQPFEWSCPLIRWLPLNGRSDLMCGSFLGLSEICRRMLGATRDQGWYLKGPKGREGGRGGVEEEQLRVWYRRFFVFNSEQCEFFIIQFSHPSFYDLL